MNAGSLHARAHRRRQHRQDRNCHLDRAAALFGRNRCNVIADVLPTEPHGVASAQAGVEQRVEPNTLTCADWPSPFIGSDVSLSPNRRGCWSH